MPLRLAKSRNDLVRGGFTAAVLATFLALSSFLVPVQGQSITIQQPCCYGNYYQGGAYPGYYGPNGYYYPPPVTYYYNRSHPGGYYGTPSQQLQRSCPGQQCGYTRSAQQQLNRSPVRTWSPRPQPRQGTLGRPASGSAGLFQP